MSWVVEEKIKRGLGWVGSTTSKNDAWALITNAENDNWESWLGFGLAQKLWVGFYGCIMKSVYKIC